MLERYYNRKFYKLHMKVTMYKDTNKEEKYLDEMHKCYKKLMKYRLNNK